eukprot:9451899-Pyramimonas_sp.AAC.1
MAEVPRTQARVNWANVFTIRPSSPLQRDRHAYYLLWLRGLDTYDRIGEPAAAHTTADASHDS